MSKKNKFRGDRYQDDEEINEAIQSFKGEGQIMTPSSSESAAEKQSEAESQEQRLKELSEAHATLPPMLSEKDVKDRIQTDPFPKPKNIPVCNCCKTEWEFSPATGRVTRPGCGCALYPRCAVCKRCELHCHLKEAANAAVSK